MKMTSNAAAVAKRVKAWSANVTPELARATLEVATTIVGNAKREAPAATGRLRRSISYVAGGEARYIVSPNVPYAVPVHEGSKAHLIQPVRKRALFWKGAVHPVRVVHHPGTRPNPFMQRGLKASQPTIRQIVERCGHQIVTR
jgi:Bacteriophage HK97-gp10, putative tail-component